MAINPVENSDINFGDTQSLPHVHLLPAFLIEVSGLVLQISPVGEVADRSDKKQWARSQHLHTVYRLIVFYLSLICINVRERFQFHKIKTSKDRIYSVVKNYVVYS